MDRTGTVELEFKPDFEPTRQRWIDFWAGHSERPMLRAIIEKPGVKPVPRPPYAAGFDGDYSPVVDQVLAWAETHEFLGDTIPAYYLEFGPDQFTTFLGADMKPSSSANVGGWVEHSLGSLDDVEIRFQPDCYWWKRYVECVQMFRERCDGKVMVAATTMTANLDCLVAMRGTENLIMDLVDNPQAVHRALEQVTRAHQEIAKVLKELLDVQTYGSVNRHGLYSPGFTNIPQCDLSCMISPDMFREFTLPHLKREMDHIDHPEYHLDGPGAIKHLESLCEIDKLRFIQWQPGAGEAASEDWTWLYEKIDSLDRGTIREMPLSQVKDLPKQYTSKQIVCNVSNVKSRQEFENCLKKLEDQ
jgi:hypothetical protein